MKINYEIKADIIIPGVWVTHLHNSNWVLKAGHHYNPSSKAKKQAHKVLSIDSDRMKARLVNEIRYNNHLCDLVKVEPNDFDNYIYFSPDETGKLKPIANEN